MEKSLDKFTYQLDHGELVDPSGKMHSCHGVLVGAVELNVDAVAVDKAVDNGMVMVRIREAVASAVSQTMAEDFPFVRHAFVLIRYRMNDKLSKKKPKLTKHERGCERCV